MCPAVQLHKFDLFLARQIGRLNGGIPTGQTGFDAFTGDIALLRYYQGTVMSQAQVQAKFDEGQSIREVYWKDELKD